MRSETVLAVAATLLAAPLHSGPKEDARRALDECRTLVEAGELVRAIPRCDEAAALDFGLVEAHFLLGQAHAALARPAHVGGAPSDAAREAHRKSGMESLRRYLAVAADGGPGGRRARMAALGELLGLYILGDEEDEALVPYADELAAMGTTQFEHLMYLAGTYERHRRWSETEEVARKAMAADPARPEGCLSLAVALGRAERPGGPDFDQMVATLERCARMTPRDPVGYFRLESLLWDKAYRDPSLPPDRKAAYVLRGLAHADNALAIDPDYLEAVIYKGLLLRLKALGASPDEQERLLEEAGALQRRAAALRSAGRKTRPDPYAGYFTAPPSLSALEPMPKLVLSLPEPTHTLVRSSPAPVPTLVQPSPAGPSFPLATGASFGEPVPGTLRVGGKIPVPRKVKDVPPAYPDIAKQARVQGVVIIECTVGADGKVKGGRVLRSIPLLDAAAIDAVRQWEFEPTVYEGSVVPVIMTVTVNFRLS